MRFGAPLVRATLLRRYKRFLADVRLENGELATAHCPNTGSMMGCAEPGSPVWLSRSPNLHRKYALTWELVEVGEGSLVGINTSRSNSLVREAIETGVVAELTGYEIIQPEVRLAEGDSRVDFLLEGGQRLAPCYVEVKNVTAAVRDDIALFPDAVSVRGSKHLRALAHAVGTGARGVVCFCVQRADVREVRPADAIDPEYGRLLREVTAAGVEAIAYKAAVSPSEIRLEACVPVVCP
ncbi:MAG: DNA/RNA nuclease SfsA [Gammaproteobacteria bacterium]|nr:DNA/RNA nuclease SfsA [Gammaproteobacteria bacterium]NIR84147.1 DNA/RNA nuclease SfsA [Gammaproteobacteria bacterium]NIR89459.1 DNA/RNA nuclease SfsA [Gammaproteobacteria bacterium]NIU05302.1 DNA/RNA nuclease SfsA [Gammaproteobacteria bacterium]NIV52242.1 DNA/RNA nuclease SfsA [Gammaproteobacteria bacterium]